MTERHKILIVEDTTFHSQVLLRILEKYPHFDVVGVATNGKEAIKEVILKSPELITLDLEMPLIDGFTFLRWLMFTRPTKTIIVSSRGSQQNVFKALELGALDFVVKTSRRASKNISDLERELIRKLEGALKADLKKVVIRKKQVMPKTTSQRIRRPPEWGSELKGVIMASSTGGPPAIQSILQAMPEDFPASIIINQHMPAGFTALFSKRLNSLTKLRVKEAEDKEVITDGVYIAPGNSHMELEKRGGRTRARIVQSQSKDRYIPSADVLLASAAKVFGRECVGVILTGMGEDGAIGLEELKKTGGMVIAEDEKTCVVYGMPKVAIERGLADKILPLDEIAAALVKLSRC